MIDEADAALQTAIDALSAELSATNEQLAQLETFVTVVCVLSCVAIGGCGILGIAFFVEKKKKD